ncbi:Replication termination factor 2 [Pleurostoma richardsiae]|uniref:Replication termination factor 2 n=1 Tax=Pleurostoma richardsiae TaxID=41990 RepID=A0AA38RNG1_9PEZI|nr:Replication termination factor 2 [Pleurostoma richardsiae]
MGNDGGSIPTRRELVKSATRAPTVSELKATALESLSHAWSYDPLSDEPLDLDDVVSDWRGRLYNYESVLKALLPSSDGAIPAPSAESTNNSNGATGQELTFAATDIHSLRDVVRLKFKWYAPAKGQEVWACPLSLKELGPATKAVYLVPCGHVFAEVAIREMSTETACPECNEDFDDANVISILPTEKADLERLRRRIEDLRARGLTHSLKKEKNKGDKKKKRKAEEGDNRNDKRKGADTVERDEHHPAKASKASTADVSASRVSGINNPMTALLTAKVLVEQQERNKQRKLASASG